MSSLVRVRSQRDGQDRSIVRLGQFGRARAGSDHGRCSPSLGQIDQSINRSRIVRRFITTVSHMRYPNHCNIPCLLRSQTACMLITASCQWHSTICSMYLSITSGLCMTDPRRRWLPPSSLYVAGEMLMIDPNVTHGQSIPSYQKLSTHNAGGQEINAPFV